MNEKPKTTELPPEENPSPPEPGLTESIGSFPVWMLKIIDLVTPDILIEGTKANKDFFGGKKK